MNAFNPYIHPWRRAKAAAANSARKGHADQAAWFERIAQVHEQAARAFHAANKIARNQEQRL